MAKRAAKKKEVEVEEPEVDETEDGEGEAEESEELVFVDELPSLDRLGKLKRWIGLIKENPGKVAKREYNNKSTASSTKQSLKKRLEADGEDLDQWKLATRDVVLYVSFDPEETLESWGK